MNEIDINIEGYNVNGICVGCLNYNRKMYYQKDVKDCYKILADIDIPIGISVKICYECVALVHKVFEFRLQILSSFKVLKDYSKKHPILNSPKDLTAHAIQRFSHITRQEQEIVPKDEITVDIVKTENIFDGFSTQLDEQELKSEIEDIYIQEDNFVDVRVSSDDDVTLSSLKKEKTKKKKKSKEKKKPEIVPHKLKNLPSFVTLYTMSETEMWCVREKDITSKEFSKLKNKCDGCIITFNSKKLMEMHQYGKHTAKSETAQQCDVCTAYFLTRENLSSHRRLHMNAYKCHKCGLVSSLKRVMLAHECVRPLESYKCADCDMKFSALSRLAYHRSANHSERPQCDCCGKIFANKMTLKYHLKVLSQNKPKPPKEAVSIPCKCGKVFHSKKSYRSHVVIHDNRSYPCPTCGKLFQWKRNLARHARNHRERDAGTTHACRACGKTFASRDCYNNHMRLSKRHVPESQYTHACSYCSKKFATKWCLVDHVDWEHLKRIKYQCNVCFKAFKTAKIMYAHISYLHAGKKVALGEHLCHVCGKSYKTVKRLKSHVWAMHTNRTQEKSFKCPSCPAAFSWNTSVYKHLKLMHPKRNKPMRVPGGRELFPEQAVPQ